MATVRMTSVREECTGSAEEIFNAVLASAMAGCRAMAIIAGQDEDAAAVAQAVGSRMEAAGAVVMVAIAHPGATLRDLIDPIAASAPSEGPEALALRLLQGEDAGLLTVIQAQSLDPEVLKDLLSLSQIDLRDGRVLQVLLAGNAGLNAQLDSHADQQAAYQIRVLRWLLASSALSQDLPLAGTSRRSFRRVSALCLLIATAAAGWFAADRFLTEVSVAAVETPAEPALPMDLLVSTNHGPAPTLRSGETVVVQVETGADKFVYCYYMDSFRQVARIFPNRFQLDAFIPAGQRVQIPPGPESERPFNIRLDKAGRLEVITCLASSIEVDRSQIDGTDIEDLTPIPGLGLQDLFDAFGRLSGTEASSQTLPINVVADADGQPLRP